MHREWIWLVLVVVAVALGVRLSGRPAEVEPVPLDVRSPTASAATPTGAPEAVVRLEAYFTPGYRDWRPWKITVEPSGRAFVLRYGDRKPRSVEVSPARVEALFEAVSEVQFLRLDGCYAYASDTRHDTLDLIAVTTSGRTHPVSVWAPDFPRDNPEVRRFLQVWAALERAVPSPNAALGDGPGLYLR